MGCSHPAPCVQGIFQARILEWVAICFFKGSPKLGFEPASPALAGRFFITDPPGKPCILDQYSLKPSKTSKARKSLRRSLRDMMTKCPECCGMLRSVHGFCMLLFSCEVVSNSFTTWILSRSLTHHFLMASVLDWGFLKFWPSQLTEHHPRQHWVSCPVFLSWHTLKRHNMKFWTITTSFSVVFEDIYP